MSVSDRNRREIHAIVLKYADAVDTSHTKKGHVKVTFWSKGRQAITYCAGTASDYRSMKNFEGTIRREVSKMKEGRA